MIRSWIRGRKTGPSPDSEPFHAVALLRAILRLPIDYAQTLRSIDRVVTDGLGDVLRLDVVMAFQVGDHPRHAQDLVVGPGGESHVVHRRFEDRQRLGLQGAELPHLARGHPAVDLRAARAESLPSMAPPPSPGPRLS
jgi:hypothetical protein